MFSGSRVRIPLSPPTRLRTFARGFLLFPGLSRGTSRTTIAARIMAAGWSRRRVGRCCVTGRESVSHEKLNVRWDLCGHDMRKPVVHNPRDRSSGQGIPSLVAKQGGAEVRHCPSVSKQSFYPLRLPWHNDVIVHIVRKMPPQCDCICRFPARVARPCLCRMGDPPARVVSAYWTVADGR